MSGIDFDVVSKQALTHERGAAQIGQRIDTLAGSHAAADIGDLPLGIAIDQQVGLGIEQNRTADFFRPVIKMRDAPQ